MVKAGFINNHQRYKCKHCGHHFTTGYQSKPYKLKRLAVVLYMEGLSIRGLSKILGISNVAALGWIKKFARGIDIIRQKKKCVYYSIRKEDISEFLSEMKENSQFTWYMIGTSDDYSQIVMLR